MRNLTVIQAVAYATELGLAFATSVLLGLFVGHVIDDRMNNGAPIFTLVGAIVGLVAGAYSAIRLIRMVTSLPKE